MRKEMMLPALVLLVLSFNQSSIPARTTTNMVTTFTSQTSGPSIDETMKYINEKLDLHPEETADYIPQSETDSEADTVIVSR